MAAFGIYILTYPKDYHLSAALVRSLRYFNPALPITVIPGSPLPERGFPASSYPIPGVEVLEKPRAFSHAAEYVHDRKFWCFEGHYERFLYIDADVLNLRSIDSLIQRVQGAEEPFIFVNLPATPQHQQKVERIAVASRDQQRRFQRFRVGNIDNIERFDPTYDWSANYGFNGGLWASSVNSFPVAWFNALREREERFFSENLGRAWADNNKHDLFYGDQGRLSYLAYSNEVNVLDLHPDGHYVWGGHAFDVSDADLLANRSPAPFIHWAGVPRPSESLFTRSPLFYFYSKLNSGDYTFSTQRQVPARNAWDRFAVAGLKRPVRRTVRDVRWVLLPAFRRMLPRGTTAQTA